MAAMRRKQIPSDSLLALRHRLDGLPRKSPQRAAQVAAIADMYGVSPATVYRALGGFPVPRAISTGRTSAGPGRSRKPSSNGTANWWRR